MAKLIIALMYSDEMVYDRIKDILINKFGKIKAESDEYKFIFTDYYEKEMGGNLRKRFVVFMRPINKNDLVDIKIKTDNIEKQFSVNGKRRINLDPGYLTKKELVLASWKKANFKEFAGKKVYYHKVLEFKDGKAVMFKHTFRDYKLIKNQDFFIK